jgi:hypothetical protein
MGGFRGKRVVAGAIGVVLTFGLVAIGAPGAGASTGRSVKVLRGPSFFSAVNPCNEQTVQTTGTFRLQVASDETDVVPDSDPAVTIHVRDNQSGGGYTLFEHAEGAFSPAASSYTISPVTVTFTNGALSFYGTGTTTVFVDGTGQPTGAATNLTQTVCGEA